MTNALALRGDLPSAQDWTTMTQMAAASFRSGMLPAHIKSEQAALFIVMKGRELRVPATYALSNIAVIQGKPTANAELMLALIYRDHGDAAIVFEESTNERCTISYARRGWQTRKQYWFTKADADTAGLSSGPNGATWRKYPAAMLRARCISAVARMAFPDSISGLYTGEELGAAVKVDADGVVETVTDEAPKPPLRARTIDATTGEVTETRMPPSANFGGFCTDKEAARIREIALGKGIDLSGLANQPIPWRVVVNAVREKGGTVTVGSHGEISAREVGEALKALPDEAQSWDEVEPPAEDDGFDENEFNASVDAQVAQRRATVVDR